ncbi:MAG: hypothetical protein FJ279_22650 [Planctomycetes bacterium]|nr:hypothetical protein [Planctomycetota bacterium]
MCWLVMLLMMAVLASVGSAGEALYNGIALPDEWPPKTGELTREPLATPPYLISPPAIIPIDVGRQLFVDDFLVESTTLTRTHHRPQYYPGNPVIKPDQPWEKGGPVRAAVFSDGIWYDPADNLFKAWYWSGRSSSEPLRFYTCYATSRDGIHWEKPILDVVPGTNVVLHDGTDMWRNSSTAWLDLEEKDPNRRYKMFCSMGLDENVDGKRRSKRCMRVFFSKDGIHWTQAAESDSCGDRTTVFYNAFRKVWVFGLRTGTEKVSRCRAYHEDRDVLQGLRWGGKSRLWVGADQLDPAREDLELRRIPERPWDLVPSQLYNLDCVAYESVLLGLFSIWRGHPLKERPKINEVCVGYSRDGFHWTRPDRRAFCPVSENKGDWNWGNVQSAGGCCLVVGDKLYFYVGGAGLGVSGDPSCTGLAILRRDGFTSMDAAEQEGTLTTRKVRSSGRHCFVNVAAAKGELRVEVLDSDGEVIAPFTKANCLPITADSTLQRVQWKGADDLSSLSGRPVRFRLHLRNGQLYAFWVSPDASGASHGYVAAGGPGFTGPTDTVGQASYRAAD